MMQNNRNKFSFRILELLITGPLHFQKIKGPWVQRRVVMKISPRMCTWEDSAANRAYLRMIHSGVRFSLTIYDHPLRGTIR